MQIKTKYQEIYLVSYGKSKFNLKKFKQIKSINHMKPEGGFWASPVESKFGWLDWCKRENFHIKHYARTKFVFLYCGNFLIINDGSNLSGLPWRYLYKIKSIRYLDFEKLYTSGVDAIYMTLKGEQETRYIFPMTFYGWDCESVLIMNPDGISMEIANEEVTEK